MQKISAFITAVLVTSMLTACGGTDTARVTSVKSTVSKTIESEVTTVSETDTLSAESEKITTETYVEPVESVSDTEAVEEAETAHWDTIVYDTIHVLNANEWFYAATDWVAGYEEHETLCMVSEAVNRLNVPDEVTSYLYEQSATYKDWVDNDKPIRNISSGVKDFDSDGVIETLYAINYLYNEGVDIVIYNEKDGIVYWSGDDSDGDYVDGNVGYYFVSDPVVECQSFWIEAVGETFTTWEGENMYFTDDNMFISCCWDVDMYPYAGNHYYRLVSDNGEYHIEYVGRGAWITDWDDTAGERVYYRKTLVEGDVPCVLIQ